AGERSTIGRSGALEVAPTKDRSGQRHRPRVLRVREGPRGRPRGMNVRRFMRRKSTATEAPPSTLDVPHPRYFFVHVMKTAGRTLLRHFRGNFELDEIYPYGKLDIRYDGDRVDIRHHLEVACLLRLPEERVRRIRVYGGHYPYVASELLGGEFIRMTILRDPVARTISLLRQFRRKAPWADPNLRHSAPGEGLTLEQVYDNELVYEPLVLNHQTKIFSMTTED